LCFIFNWSDWCNLFVFFKCLSSNIAGFMYIKYWFCVCLSLCQIYNLYISKTWKITIIMYRFYYIWALNVAIKYKICLLTSRVFFQFCYIINAGPQLWLLRMLCKWAHCKLQSLWCDITVFCSQNSLHNLTLYTTAHNDSAQVTVLWTAKYFTTSLVSLSFWLCLILLLSANSFHIQTNRHSIKSPTHVLSVF